MWLTHQGSVRIIRHHDSSANALSTNLRTVGRKKELPRVQIPHTLPHRTPFLSILQESKLPVIAILDISGNIKLRWLQQWNTDIVDNIIKTGWVRRRCNQKGGWNCKEWLLVLHTRKQMGSIPISSTIYDRLVERLTRLPFKEEIAGSNPVPVTIYRSIR